MQEPINIGLYELTIKETPDRGQLKFYKRLGSATLPEYTLAVTLTVEGETTPSYFTHDKEFSAEVGHFAYARNKDNKGFAPTPYNPALFAADNKDTNNTGTAESTTDTTNS